MSNEEGKRPGGVRPGGIVPPLPTKKPGASRAVCRFCMATIGTYRSPAEKIRIEAGHLCPERMALRGRRGRDTEFQPQTELDRSDPGRPSALEPLYTPISVHEFESAVKGPESHTGAASLGLTNPFGMRELNYDRVLEFAKNSKMKLPDLLVFLDMQAPPSKDLGGSTQLSEEQAERLARLSRLYDAAAEMLDEDREAAARWMAAPKRDLNKKKPIELAKTEEGAQQVASLIGRIEFGVF